MTSAKMAEVAKKLARLEDFLERLAATYAAWDDADRLGRDQLARVLGAALGDWDKAEAAVGHLLSDMRRRPAGWNKAAQGRLEAAMCRMKDFVERLSKVAAALARDRGLVSESLFVQKNV